MADTFRQDRLMKVKLWSPLAPLVLALSAFVFGIDQTHKWWMLAVYDIEQKAPVAVTPFFELTLVWNKGVSYGLLKTHTQELLIALSIIITGMLWVWACRVERPLGAAALALVIGGALANALDRVVRGAVADFFHLHLGQFSWYVFNIADIAIVAGVALLLYESVFDGGTENRRGKAGFSDQ